MGNLDGGEAWGIWGDRWGACAVRVCRGCARGTQEASAVTILAQWQGDLLTLACEGGGLYVAALDHWRRVKSCHERPYA